jgi:hypothetical protein
LIKHWILTPFLAGAARQTSPSQYPTRLLSAETIQRLYSADPPNLIPALNHDHGT